MDSTGTDGSRAPSAATPRNTGTGSRGHAAHDGRRLTHRIIAGALMVALVIVGLTAAMWWRLRQDQLDDGLSALSAVDLLIAAQTERAFETVDVLLSDISGDLQAEGIATAAALRQATADDATHRLLGAKMEGVQQLDALAIVDANGDILNRTGRYPITPPVNVASRDYFLRLRDHPELKYYISPPAQNASGALTIYIGRRLSAPNGAFVGFVLGAIRLPFFESLYRDYLNALVGEGKSVSLWRDDGTLLVRSPARAAPDNLSGAAPNDAEASEFHRLAPKSGLASFWAEDSRGTFAVAARRLDDFPLTIETSQAKSAILSIWTDKFLATELGGAALLALVGLATWLLLRQLGAAALVTEARALAEHEVEERRGTQRAMAKAEAAMREAQQSEARFRDIAEVGSDWIWETDAQHRFTMIAGAKQPKLNLIGKTHWDQAGADPETDETWRLHKAELDAHHPFRQLRYAINQPQGRRDVCVSGKPIFDDDGSFIGYRGTVTDETELVDARLRAERADRLLRNAVESIDEGFVIYDADDRFVMCNEAYRRIYADNNSAMIPGTRYEDIMRAALSTGRYPDAQGREEEWLAEWMRKHRERGEPVEKYLGDGRWIMISDHHMADGGTAGLRIDITAMKAVHESLRESQVMLNRAQRLSGTGSVVRNLKTGATEWSDEMYRICGLTRESFVPETKAFLDLVHPEDRAQVTAAVAAGAQGLTEAPMQFRIVRPDGTVRWVYREADLWHDPDGAAWGRLATYKDVTSRLAHETRQRQLETLLRDAIDSISEGFVIYDAEDRLVLCNDAYRRLYPRSAELLVAGTPWETILRAGIARGIYPEARGREDEWLAKQLRSHREIGEPVEMQLQDGRWLLISERRTSNGGTAGLRIDITALKRVQQSLRESQERLDRTQRISHLGTVERNLRTNDVVWSDETYRIFGVSLENYAPSASNLLALVHPDDRAQLMAVLRRGDDEHANSSLKFRIVRPNGDIRVIACQADIGYDEAGQPLYCQWR